MAHRSNVSIASQLNFAKSKHVATIVAMTLILLCTAVLLARLAQPNQEDGTGAPIQYLVDVAHERPYYPLAGQFHANEIPWIFDGRFILYGTVVNWWRADTAPNRRSCTEEWSRAAPYAKLCGEIADQKILAVMLKGMRNETLVFIPVSRIAHIDIGDTVSIRSGVIAENNRLEKLPELLSYHHHLPR